MPSYRRVFKLTLKLTIECCVEVCTIEIIYVLNIQIEPSIYKLNMLYKT